MGPTFINVMGIGTIVATHSFTFTEPVDLSCIFSGPRIGGPTMQGPLLAIPSSFCSVLGRPQVQGAFLPGRL